MIIQATAKNKIYDTVFPIIDKTDIFLLIFYLLFFKSNFAVSPLILCTNPDEVPITNRSPTDFAPTLHRLWYGGRAKDHRRKNGSKAMVFITDYILSRSLRIKKKNVQKFNFYLHFITISQIKWKNRKKTFFFRLIYIFLHSTNQKTHFPALTL